MEPDIDISFQCAMFNNIKFSKLVQDGWINLGLDSDGYPIKFKENLIGKGKNKSLDPVFFEYGQAGRNGIAKLIK